MVEKYAADNFESENGIRVATTDLFHTSEGIPIIVMEKVELFEDAWSNPRISRNAQPELFGEGPGQVSMNEEITAFERMSQIGISSAGKPVIFDAGDW